MSKTRNQLMETLHKTFITPLDREEIRQLISGLDDILDFIDATSQRIVMYDLCEVTPDAQELGASFSRRPSRSRKPCGASGS